MGSRLVWFKNFWQRIAEAVPLKLASAAVTLDPETHQRKSLVFDKADGVVATLPAALGTGDKYDFSVATTITSNSYKVQVANATDIIQGALLQSDDAGNDLFVAGATADTITLAGTTTGGNKGTRFSVTDVAAGLWIVEGVNVGSGIGVTPFSASVS